MPAEAGCTPWAELGLTVIERDWLSANQSVFAASAGQPATVVDTGYSRHAPLTLALLAQVLAGQPLGAVVNTHLHSDHCGGNQAVQQLYPGVRTWVPAAAFAAAQAWDMDRLSYRATGQHCPPFQVDAALHPGQTLRLGPADWQVWAAPGHDPDAVLLFEPDTRTLIAGDALWQDRLAIIFPELDGQPGFAPTRQTLALIERLVPRWVVPGHGPVFDDVAGALAASRARLDSFERQPQRHQRHAARALVMFHMMEHLRRPRAQLEAWLPATPLFRRLAEQAAHPGGVQAWAVDLVAQLLDEGLLAQADGWLHLPASAPA